MKKFIVEYMNIIGTTLVGLLFGLSFFLLFLNFYHYKEVGTLFTPTYETEEEKPYNKLMTQVALLKQNAASYNQNTYQGQEDVFDMLGIQAKLNTCASNFESEELKNLLTRESYSAEDIYELISYYQNKILNDCVVIQLYSLGDSTSTAYKSERLRAISPFLKAEMDNLLHNSTGYIKSNLKNNDIYYFSNDDSKNTVFFLTKDSYYEIVNQYMNAINFVNTLSDWYKRVAIGG